MSIDDTLILFAVLGAATFCIAYPVMADVRLWTREGWNWWLVSLGLAVLGATEVADNAVSLPDWLDTGTNRVIYALFVALTWHRVLLLLTARREVRRSQNPEE